MLRILRGCALLLLACTVPAGAAEVPLGPLSRDVVPVAYVLDLRMDPRAERFSGEVRVDVDVRKAVDVFFMHARGSSIRNATIKQGDSVTTVRAEIVDAAGGVLKVTAPKPLGVGRAQVQIAFDAPYDLRLQGAYKVKSGGLDYVMTQMEPIGARNAFPCFDEPAFKQPWTVSITAPAADTAIFNTRETSVEKQADGWVKHHYALTLPLPSYLIAFAVGPWELVEFAAIPKTELRDHPIPLRGVAAKGQGERMRYMLGETAKMVTALEDYFAYPYPYDKLDLLAAPEFAYGAMENAGLITYRDSLMFADLKGSTSQRRGAISTHIHELAHQWFGNLVTMPWWDDIWLNESFASWSEAQIGHDLYPELEAEMDLLGGGLGAMGSDSRATARRIHNPVEEWTEINSTFDGITYQKGGAVLAMMERFLGAEKFRAALRAHMRKFAFGNATSVDLADSLAAQSSEPDALRRAFASFTDQAGVPMLATTLSCAEGRSSLAITQSRYRPIGGSFSTDTKWLVPMCLRVGRANTSSVECHLLTEASETITLGGDTCADYVHPNADGAGYYRFSLDKQAQAGLAKAFAQLNAFEQRVMADSASAALGSGAMRVSAFLDTAPDFAKASQSDVITAPLGDLEWIKERVATPAQIKRIDAMLRNTWGAKLKALGIDHAAADSESTKSLRAELIGFLAVHGQPEWLTRELAARGRKVIGLGGDGALHADAVHRDLLGSVLRAVVDADGKPAFDLIERHLAKNEDSVIRSALMGALASATDAKLSARAMQIGLTPAIKPGEVTRIYFGSADHPGNHPALWAFVQKHYEELLAKVPSVWQGKIASLGSSALCTDQGATELDAFFASRVQNLEGGPRALAQSIEGVKLCAARVAAHRQS